jgi:urease accessory protein
MSASYLALLLADGRLPTGAHTQSAGLEPALRDGMTLAEVPSYLAARLQTITEVVAAAAVLHAPWLTASDRRAGEVTGPGGCVLSDVARDARPARPELARLVTALWPLGLEPGLTYCRAVVVGAAAAAGGLDGPSVARVIGYDEVQTVIGAALKLSPFDPVEGVRWSLAAEPQVAQLVARVAGLTRVADMPAYSAPQMEQWAQLHRTAERRLYRA